MPLERSLHAYLAPQSRSATEHGIVQRTFTAAERDRVAILFGGLTSKHEWLIKFVFQACRCRARRPNLLPSV